MTLPQVDSLVIHTGASLIKITLVQLCNTEMRQETKTACLKQQSLTPFNTCYAISIASAIAIAADFGRF